MTHIQGRYGGEDPRERERETRRHKDTEAEWQLGIHQEEEKKKTSPAKYLSGGAASTIHSLSAVM